VAHEEGARFLEGAPGRQLLRTVDDATFVVEACLSQGVDCVLLDATNLTDRFFDLSSGEAGAILQKLRNYGIRLAVLCSPSGVRFSSRFGEMVAQESPGYFRLCESREAARDWLRQGRGISEGGG
jgi:hypothetical protein